MLIRHPYEPKGGALQLWYESYPEVLIEGPAGTGKTRAVLEKLNLLAEENPGIRILVFRKTRASLTESVLVTFEEHVLLPDSPVKQGASRATRKRYKYPNGSTIILAGMDMSSRILSTEFDVAYGAEANECAEDDIQLVSTRLRNTKVPLFNPDGTRLIGKDGKPKFWRQLILDCNPVEPTNWLNRRPARLRKHGELKGMPQAARILSRHADNPTVDEEYLDRLRNLTGVRRKRLYEGLWAAAEGMFYPMFDATRHVVLGQKFDNYGRRYSLLPRFDFYLGARDWGYHDPGVLQVWGVTNRKEMILLREVYETQHNEDWWADQTIRLMQQFRMKSIVCDPAEPKSIDTLNDRLAQAGYRVGKDTETRIAVAGDNDFQAGVSVCRDLMEDSRDTGEPRIRFVADALVRRDPELEDSYKPMGVVDEIPSYICNRDRNDIIQEWDEPPNAINHGCAAMRYAAMFVWGSDYRSRDPKKKYPRGTLGHKFGHEELGVG